MKKLVFLFLLIPCLAWAQADDRNVYGEADFARRDAFPRDNLIGCWNYLTPGVEGNQFGDDGKFETWTGAEGGCTNCPQSWTCNCAGTSDIDQETALFYEGNNAVKYAVSAAGDQIDMMIDFTLESNEAYQLTFKSYKATAGGNFNAQIRCTVPASAYYNATTDTWGAFANNSFSHTGGVWDDQVLYIIGDAVARSSCTLTLIRSTANITYYLDNVQFQKLKSIAPVSDTSLTMTNYVTSDPIFDQNKEFQSFRGQPGPWGMWLDGSTTCLDRADDDTFDPIENSGHISLGARFITSDNTQANQDVGGKGLDWRLYLGTGNDFGLLYQIPSAASDNIVRSNQVNSNQLYSGVVTYHNIGDTISEGRVYLVNQAPQVDNTLRAPIRDTAKNFGIGCRSDINSNNYNGGIQQLCIWDGVLSAIDAAKYNNPHFPANDNTQGFYHDNPTNAPCDQNASHATCSWDSCREGTGTDACQAEDTGFLAVFAQCTTLLDNNSWETNSATQDNPTFTGYTYTETPGDGTASVTQYFGDAKHGDASVRIKLTGTTSSATISTTCLAMNGSTDHFAYVAARYLDRLVPSNIDLIVDEFSDAGCSADQVTNTFDVTSTMTPNWMVQKGTSFSTAATTNFYQISIQVSGGLADVLLDTIDIKEAYHFTPWTYCASGSGTCTYNRRDYSLHNVLVDYIEAEDADAYTTGYCFGLWIYSDWNGGDGAIHRILNIPGTAGNNNRTILSTGGVNHQFIIYDNAGVTLTQSMTANATNWTAGAWKYIEICTDNTGTMDARHYNVSNSTWYDWGSVGVGTGIYGNQDDELEVGQGGGANHIDGYFGPFKIGPYNAIWPQYAYDKMPTKSPY
jgi:hypothetical protein